MLKRIIALFILSFMYYSLLTDAAPLSYASAVKKAAPAVVNVYTLRETNKQHTHTLRVDTYHQLRPILKNRIILGSGVLMDEQGYILTNSHVVRDRKQILVALSDGRTVRAQLVGMDPETDLAVLKINLDNIPFATIGNSDELQVGDVVLAIGNPFGLGRTVTQGIISALGRTAVGLSNIENFIQTDVALNPGSSGGALINTQGQLIGINTGIYTRSGGYQGVSFAIPVNAAENILRQIVKYGSVKRGWLGLEVVNLDPMLIRDLKTQQTMGVVVEKVLRRSPAFDKLKVNDLITTVNSRKVHNASGFMSYIAQRKPGDEIILTFYRNNIAHKMTIKLGARKGADNLWHEMVIRGKKYVYPDDRV